jgi:hypothetical protein
VNKTDNPCNDKAASENMPLSGACGGNPSGMTLEQVIEITGELGHLNELVMVHVKKTGGFSGTEAYFETVQPLLDLLEAEIRENYVQGMSHEEIKRIVKNWIDREMTILS